MTGRALVAQANVIARGRDGHGGLPLRDGTIDLIACSPPYLWKRKYAISGAGEMGNEANWRLFLDNLFAATDEMLRVLKPSGSIFVNLGDTRVTSREPKWLGVPPKSRLLIPERYRVGCQDRYAAHGVIVRQVQIWEKANGLPEAVTDRTRDTHEDWMQLVKRPNYYSAVDEIRRAYSPKTFTVSTSPRRSDTETAGDKRNKWHIDNGVSREDMVHPLGALPGSVWTVPSEPLRLPRWLGIDHYAAFPGELVRRLVLAFSPPGICVACGEGRWPVVDYSIRLHRPGGAEFIGKSHTVRDGQARSGANIRKDATILGYACRCCPFTDHPGTGESSGPDGRYGDYLAEGGGYANVGAGFGGKGGLGDRPKVGPWREYHLTGWQAPPTRPAVVLDPFGGVGTTAMVARALGRVGLSFDLSFPYSRAADWRIHHSGQHGKAISRTNLERQQVLGL